VSRSMEKNGFVSGRLHVIGQERVDKNQAARNAEKYSISGDTYLLELGLELVSCTVVWVHTWIEAEVRTGRRYVVPCV